MSALEEIFDISSESTLFEKASESVKVLLEVEEVVRAIRMATYEGQFVPTGALDGAQRLIRAALALAEDLKTNARTVVPHVALAPVAPKRKAVRS